MKTSNRILLFVGLGIIMLFLIGAIIARLYFYPELIPYDPANIKEKIITENNFSGISCNGSWHITVKQGDEYEIRIFAPEKLFDKLSVSKAGQILEFDLPVFALRKNPNIEARIIMPQLKTIKARGLSQIGLEGFNMQTQILDITGENKIQGKNNHIDDLILNCSGMSIINFRESKINNATLNVTGGNTVELYMNGGVLTGDISGTSNIIYYGNVQSQTIAVTGFSTVTKKQ